MSRSTSLRDHVAAGILDIAAEVLAERGDSASMVDIAAAAGVARATLYRYFPNRDALLRALYEAAFADLDERISDAQLDAAPIDEAIARMTRAVLAATNKYRALGLFKKTPGEAQQADHRLTAPLRAVFERGAAEGSFRDDLPVQTLAEVYFGLLEGTVSRVIQGQLGVEQASAAITGIFLNGVLDASGHGR
ncbi:TetR/AcrR family transcriptional regulator [Actinoallomurus acaciae]|uniref:TetR/AcrR family transcriptional regulator n=1 Tax=Actinoallomurus acaciae TaxID=502577 RepID=A0ABV5Y707_9ACTN